MSRFEITAVEDAPSAVIETGTDLAHARPPSRRTSERGSITNANRELRDRRQPARDPRVHSRTRHHVAPLSYNHCLHRNYDGRYGPPARPRSVAAARLDTARGAG